MWFWRLWPWSGLGTAFGKDQVNFASTSEGLVNSASISFMDLVNSTSEDVINLIIATDFSCKSFGLNDCRLLEVSTASR